MGYQVIRQPGTDMFGVFSSERNQFVMWDATREDVVDLFVRDAKRSARINANHTLDMVEAGTPRMVYAQSVKTWDQAVVLDREHGGVLSAELDAIHGTAEGAEL